MGSRGANRINGARRPSLQVVARTRGLRRRRDGRTEQAGGDAMNRGTRLGVGLVAVSAAVVLTAVIAVVIWNPDPEGDRANSPRPAAQEVPSTPSPSLQDEQTAVLTAYRGFWS